MCMHTKPHFYLSPKTSVQLQWLPQHYCWQEQESLRNLMDSSEFDGISSLKGMFKRESKGHLVETASVETSRTKYSGMPWCWDMELNNAEWLPPLWCLLWMVRKSLTVKGSSEPARNKLKTLPTFRAKWSGLPQGKDRSLSPVFPCHRDSRNTHLQVSP